MPGAQDLLACLAPFTGVVHEDLLKPYTEHLKQQPPLAHLPFDRWPDVLKEARAWGLLGRDAETPPGYLRVQPIFPFFLRNRLNAPDRVEARRAVEEAFRQHYNGVSSSISDLLGSKSPQDKQLGQVLARLEYENMAACLRLDLDARDSILQPYRALSGYIDVTQDHRRGLELGKTVLGRLAEYPEDKLAGPLGAEFVGVLDDIAKRQLSLKQNADAEKSYRKALALWLANTNFDASDVKRRSASIYHQLGMVAQEQRQWAQAEEHYRKALEIYVEFDDRYEQAGTYHQLGMVAQEQRQWAQAEEHYRKALEIYVEFDDRYEQASTYHQLGMVAQEQRQWAQAEEHYRKALEIKIEFGDRYEQAWTYHQLGMVAQEQRQWAQAEEHYRKALEIYVEFGDRYEQASTYHQLGMVAQEQRQWAQAEEHYRKALEIYVEFGARYEQAWTYHQLGRVAQEQRQWAQAEEHYRKALEIYVEFDDRYEQAGTYHQLGTVAQEQRQWAQAEEHYRKALEIWVKYGDKHGEAITRSKLETLREAAGPGSIPEPGGTDSPPPA